MKIKLFYINWEKHKVFCGHRNFNSIEEVYKLIEFENKMFVAQIYYIS